MKRVVLGILGAVLGLLGLGLFAAGAVLLSVFGTRGEATVPIGTVSAPDGRAVVVTDFQISTDTPVPLDESWFDLRLRVSGDQAHFVGVAPKTASLEYLQGVPYRLVTGFDSSAGVIDATTIPGDRRPAPPQAQDIWTAQDTGTEVTVAWPVSDTDTTLVVMNESPSVGVDADVEVLITVSWAGAAGIGMAVAGLVVVIVAIIVLVLAMRSRPAPVVPGARPGG